MSDFPTEVGAAATQALELIERAFADRTMPSEMSDSMQLSDVEYEEVMSFAGLPWKDVTLTLVENAHDAVFWFSPVAFCYYLPGVLSAGLRENRADLLYFDALIGCLDRSPEPKYWDDFFYPRFTLLKVTEIDAVSAWVRWMELVEPSAYHEFTYPRVHGTLALLRDRALGSS